MTIRLRILLFTILGLVILDNSSNVNAANTVAITSPVSTGPYAPGATINIAGTVGYSWLYDTYPYSVYVEITGPDVTGGSGTRVYFAGNAASFSASYGSGTWSQSFTFPAGGPYGTYTITATSRDYYGNKLASTGLSVSVAATGTGPGGG